MTIYVDDHVEIPVRVRKPRYVPKHAAPVPTGDSWWTPTRSAAAVVALAALCLFLVAATGWTA